MLLDKTFMETSQTSPQLPVAERDTEKVGCGVWGVVGWVGVGDHLMRNDI